MADAADLQDPLIKTLLEAPESEEELTPEEEAAIQEAEEDFRRGDVLSHKQLKRELGL